MAEVFDLCLFYFSVDQGKKKTPVSNSEEKTKAAGDAEETLVDPNHVASTTEAGDVKDEDDEEKVPEEEVLQKNGGEDEEEEENEEGPENSMEEEEEDEAKEEEAKEDEEKGLNDAKMSKNEELEVREKEEIMCPEVNGQQSSGENGDLQGTSPLGSDESSGE